MELWLEESSSDDDFVDSDTEEERRRADQLVADTDHWLIQKLIRYIKVGFLVCLGLPFCDILQKTLNDLFRAIVGRRGYALWVQCMWLPISHQ